MVKRLEQKERKILSRTKGDLILKINIAQSPEYTRENDTLTKYFDVPLKNSFIWWKIEIKTIHKDITSKNPTKYKTKSKKFRVKELGVLNRKIWNKR